jgi:calpain-5
MDQVFRRIHCHVTRSNNIFDTKIEPFKNQIYEKIKTECIKNRKLFEDPLFPACKSSLFYSNRIKINLNDVVWKRPHEITKEPLKPKFIENVVNAEDLHQGSIGDCWFIASCAAIAQQPELFFKVCIGILLIFKAIIIQEIIT